MTRKSSRPEQAYREVRDASAQRPGRAEDDPEVTEVQVNETLTEREADTAHAVPEEANVEDQEEEL
jgi:hypothetical protein